MDEGLLRAGARPPGYSADHARVTVACPSGVAMSSPRP
jgi:hypothetical protein